MATCLPPFPRDDARIKSNNAQGGTLKDKDLQGRKASARTKALSDLEDGSHPACTPGEPGKSRPVSLVGLEPQEAPMQAPSLPGAWDSGWIRASHALATEAKTGSAFCF